MKQARVFIFITSLLLIGSLNAADPALSLTELLKTAAERNPDVLSAYQKWKAAGSNAGAASVWPNPRLSFTDEKDPSGQEGIEPMKRKHYGVAQDIPFPGKLTKEGRMKHHEALIAEENYRDVVLNTARQVKLAYYQLGSAERLIALAKQNAETMRRTITTTQSRVASNQGMASDVFMAQMESRRMENMVYEKVQARRETEIELNTLLDMPLEKTWPATEPPPTLANISLTLDEVQAIAEENSPHYREAQHELNHSRAMLSRSRLEYAPDIGVMYEYQTAGEGTRGTGPAGQQLGLSLSVPLWLKRPMALTAGANAHILESESVARAMTNMVRKMVAMEYIEIQTHTTLAKKIEDEILPAAQAALNTTREQYSAGRGDFLRLLEANRSWIGARVEYEEQLYHTLEHWSELERWVGAALPRAPQEK